MSPLIEGPDLAPLWRCDCGKRDCGGEHVCDRCKCGHLELHHQGWRRGGACTILNCPCWEFTPCGGAIVPVEDSDPSVGYHGERLACEDCGRAAG